MEGLELFLPGDSLFAEAKGVTAVAHVGQPLSQQVGVETGLRADRSAAQQAGGLTGDGIIAVRVGHVIMRAQPAGRGAACRAAGGTDAGGIDIPFVRLTAHELQRPRRVFQRPLHGRFNARRHGLRYETIVDRCHGDSRRKILFQSRHLRLVAPHPAASVDVKDERRGIGRLRLVKIDHLALMRAVGHIGHRGFQTGGCGGLFRRGFGLCEGRDGGAEEEGEEKTLHGSGWIG